MTLCQQVSCSHPLLAAAVLTQLAHRHAAPLWYTCTIPTEISAGSNSTVTNSMQHASSPLQQQWMQVSWSMAKTTIRPEHTPVDERPCALTSGVRQLNEFHTSFLTFTAPHWMLPPGSQQHAHDFWGVNRGAPPRSFRGGPGGHSPPGGTLPEDHLFFSLNNNL